MKPVGAAQRKPKKWTDPKHSKDKNHALAAFRKWKRSEKEKKAAETERYNSLCGPVTVSYISK
jgi:hypothetical protein